MDESQLRAAGFVKCADGEWRKPSRVGSARPASPELQKPKAVWIKPTNRKDDELHAKEYKATDGLTRGRYSTGFVFRVSDRRIRDSFGMSESVADALIRAVRRFNLPDTERLIRYRMGEPRQ